MRLEYIPIILGALVALMGLGFIADALMADDGAPSTERRRRMRTERSRAGEAIVGLGILCMAAALIGRDTWYYGTVTVIAGAVLLLVGGIMNASFIKESVSFRGPARRGDGNPDAKRTPRPKQKGSAPGQRSVTGPGPAPAAVGGAPRAKGGAGSSAPDKKAVSRPLAAQSGVDVAIPTSAVVKAADDPMSSDAGRPTPIFIDVPKATSRDATRPGQPGIPERRKVPRGKKR